jgi:hypothetical protein
VAGEQNQLEAVLHLVDAIFNCDTGHCLSFTVVISGLTRPIQLKPGKYKFFIPAPLVFIRG